MDFDEQYSEEMDPERDELPTQEDWAELIGRGESDPSADEYPDFFEFDGIGDTLTGQIDSFRWGEITPNQSDDSYMELFVNIRQTDGELVTFGFNRSYLIKRWEALDPHVGDLIYVEYEGQAEDSRADKYSMSIKRIAHHENDWRNAEDYLKGRDLFGDNEEDPDLDSSDISADEDDEEDPNLPF